MKKYEFRVTERLDDGIFICGYWVAMNNKDEFLEYINDHLSS
jgi:hypothetical protein